MMCRARLSWRSPPRCSRWRLVLPELAGIGAVPAWRDEARVGREPLGAGGVADDDRGGDRAAAMLGEQLRAVSLDQRLELGEQLAFLVVDLADPLEDHAGDPDLWAAGKPGEPYGDRGANLRADQTLWSDFCFELGGDLHEVPAQPAREPDTLVDQLVAVIVQHADRAPARRGTRPAACRSLPGARRERSRSRRSDRTSPVRARPPRALGPARARPGSPDRRSRPVHAPGGPTRAGSPRPPTPARRGGRRRTAAPQTSRHPRPGSSGSRVEPRLQNS